jgi:hypothetical protein
VVVQDQRIGHGERCATKRPWHASGELCRHRRHGEHPGSTHVEPNPNTFDPLDDFERRDLTFLGQTRRVYVAGSGPP